MSRLPAVLLAAGLALVAFAWWGMETAAGMRAFDEMAGMIPFFAGVAGVALAGIGLAWLLWRRVRRA